MPNCILRDGRRLLALRHNLQAYAGLPLAPQRTGHDVSNLPLLHVLGDGNLRRFPQHPMQSFRNKNVRQRCFQLVACPEFLTPIRQAGESFNSSLANTELSHWCCEGCDFSLTERWQSPGNILSQQLAHLDKSNLFGVHSTLVVCDALYWDVCVIACASARDRIHKSSSNIFVAVSFSFFKKMSCVLSRNRHSAGKSPVAHMTVRMSRNLKIRLPCPAPAKAIVAHPWVLGHSLVTVYKMRERSESCLAAPLFSYRSESRLVSASAPSCARCLSSLHVRGCRPRSELREIKAVVQCLPRSAQSAADLPTSPFMALLIEFFYCAVLWSAAAWFSFLCFVGPEFVQRDPELLPLPIVVDAVLILCFFRISPAIPPPLRAPSKLSANAVACPETLLRRMAITDAR